jgi:hypothetical protein
MYQPTSTRRRHGHRLAGLAAALFCALAPLGSWAAPAANPAPQVLRMAQAAEQVSLAEATRMVQERTGGQVLRAETKRDKGRAVHRIRVLTEDGRVRTVHVDAETGRMY